MTLALACAGGPRRATTQPILPLAWAAKIAFDIAQVGRLTRKEVTDVHALSAWSLVVGGATAAMVPLAVPEARAAWGHLTHGRTGSVLGRFADQRGERDQRHTGRSGEIRAHRRF